MPQRPNPEDAVKATAVKVMQQLIDVVVLDADFRAAVAHQEINRLVRSGELLPRSVLQIGSNYELIPAGRLTELEEAARAVVSAADVTGAPDAVLVAIHELEQIIDGLVALVPAPEEPPKKKPAKRKAKAKQLEAPPTQPPAQPEQPDAQPETEVASEPAKRSPSDPPTKPGKCAICNTSLDMGQTLASWTRWREPVCGDHMAYGPNGEPMTDTEEE